MLHFEEAKLLTGSQISRLVGWSLLLWAVAAAAIRFLPGLFTDPVQGGLSFVTTVPVAWLSVVLTRRIGSLDRDHLLAGVGLVGAVAMMVDGLVLHWAPSIYGAQDTTVRLGAAWLLWGYGVSRLIALVISARGSPRAR